MRLLLVLLVTHVATVLAGAGAANTGDASPIASKTSKSRMQPS